MLCPHCKKKEANVHFKGVVNGKITKLDLCEDCAKRSGFPFPNLELGIDDFFGVNFNFPTISPTLSGLLNFLAQWTPVPHPSLVHKSCSQCRWTLAQFQRTGRLGCPDCYAEFHDEMVDILSNIHGQSFHKGKMALVKSTKPAFARTIKAKATEPKDQIWNLKLQLEKAVKAEEYERAAKLRDKIRELDTKIKE